jgi:hypothetical protein
MLFNLFMKDFNVNSTIGLQDRWNKGFLPDWTC